MTDEGHRVGRLIKIQDIEQFRNVINVPEAAITPPVLDGVRRLDERRELEPMLRELLWDPTETHHGPTEISDILTSKVRVSGKPRLSAFVVKGKSFPRVRPNDIAHQVLRLRQISGLTLMVLLACGHIQDAAQRDFIQVAVDGDCDYLVVEAHDCARLMIAYEKICPQDGGRFQDDGLCLLGHEQSPAIELKVRAREGPHFEVAELRDVSHFGARRLKANVLVSRNYDREILRTIISSATKQIAQSSYSRNERLATHWHGTNAHVVMLFLATDLQDLRNYNWVARTQWIDNTLPMAMRPMKLEAQEHIDGIAVVWNETWDSMRTFYGEHTADKGEFLRRIEPLLNHATEIGERICEWIDSYDQDELSEPEIAQRIRSVSVTVDAIVHEAGSLPFPPEDVRDYDSRAQSLIGWLGNMTLYYSKRGDELWESTPRIFLVRETAKDFKADLQRLEFEREKIH